mmetsp:Transcript_19177/g.34106  ORF Transcript_19177/g.34106 Transcript_19177/m.34106 type:complete len:127 (-) Transcript_19177:669-1049(-)
MSAMDCHLGRLESHRRSLDAAAAAAAARVQKARDFGRVLENPQNDDSKKIWAYALDLKRKRSREPFDFQEHAFNARIRANWRPSWWAATNCSPPTDAVLISTPFFAFGTNVCLRDTSSAYCASTFW